MTRSWLLLAFGWAYLAVCCGQHDTAVATYLVTIPSTAGVGGGGGPAAAGAANAGAADAGAPSAGVGSDLVCGAAYTVVVPGLRSRYRQGVVATNWAAAERDCESDGGHLIVIDDDAENTWMATIAEAAKTTSDSSNQLAWIGYGDSAVEGEYHWVTAEALGPARWFPGEPNHLNGTEDCVEMRASALWNDDRCNANLTYMCECDGFLSAGAWCDTWQDATCGACSITCAVDQSCNNEQKCM